VRVILDGAKNGGKQYIIATHSPVILGCPAAQILSFNGSRIEPVEYRQTASFAFYKEFLNDPEKFFDAPPVRDSATVNPFPK